MYRYRIKLYIALALVVSISSLLVFFVREFEISNKKGDLQKSNRNNNVGKVLKSNRHIKLVPNVKPGMKKMAKTHVKKLKYRIKLTTPCDHCSKQPHFEPTTASSNHTIYLDNNVERLKRLQRVCKNNPDGFKSKSARKSYIHNTLISFNQSVIFCQIQKSASSFWKKIIFNRYKPGTVNSLSLLKLKEETNGNFFKFLFVRDPYQRLFSGYVDKLFNPNIIYWKYVGRVAKALTQGTGCGHDTTFSEFIKYIISIENIPIRRDRHFLSMYEHCEPCDHKKIDYIGKVETFNRDAEAIFKAIKMDNKTVFKYKSMLANSSLHDIESMANRLFSFKYGILKCMTMYEAVLRIWRNLQINGIIGRNIVFPFTPSTVINLTKDHFIKKLRQAHTLSRTDKTMRYNKEDAFLEAYASVPYEDLTKLKDIVENDCLLFGYDSKPKRVFNAKLFMKSKFRFFRV